jgi:peptidoglycan/LPS O-acetylase OafA/YrhL
MKNFNQRKHIDHIDGLRALAVLLVISLHLNFSIFSGGFVGVDVFFVISGFLISRVIITEININGSFNFLNFFCRRAKRLLPALMFTIILTWMLGFLIFSPKAYERLGLSIVSAIFSFSNFHYLGLSGYFDLIS